MKSMNEKDIVKIIKYSLPVLILILSSILTLSLYLINKSTLKEEISELKKEFILKNKEQIKNEVNTLYSYIKIRQEQSRNKLKDELRYSINNAYKIIENIYNENKNKSKIEITNLIKNALRELRYKNDSSYIFIYDMNGTNLLHPIKKNLENTSLLDFQDKRGTYLLKEVINAFKKKNNFFYTWYWSKYTKTKEVKKIGFFKKFKDLDIFIGIGEYEEDFENFYKEEIITYISTIKFEKHSYAFVLDFDGKYISHIRKKYVNKNAIKESNLKNAKIVIPKIIDIASTSPDYISYIINDEVNNIELNKTTYVKGFKYWKWAIGVGYYKEDLDLLIKNKTEKLNNKFNSYIKNILILSFILTILLLLVSFYLSNILESKFIKYKKSIKKYIKDNNKQHEVMSQQAKMAAMGEMIGNIAHQWRQPLSSITTAASGIKLQKEYNLLTDEILLNSLDNISESAQYLSKTIDDFRDFYNTNKNLVDFSIKETIFKSLKLVKAGLKNKNIQIITEVEEVTFKGLQNEFIQVFLNIINNAKDELEKLPDDSKRYIFINVYKKDNKIYIKIKDNAKGIRKKIIARIFEPYFTTKHQSQGTGIGLYMSSEIVEKHMKGTLSVKNEEYIHEGISYKGAEFLICFEGNKE